MTNDVVEQVESSQDNAQAAFDRFSEQFHQARENGAEAPTLDTINPAIVESEPATENVPDVSALQSEIARLQHQVLSNTGRATAFQRKYEETAKRLKEIEESTTQQGSNVRGAGTREELLSAIAEDYPELATPINELFAQFENQLSDVRGELNQTLSPIREREQLQQQQAIENLVEARHPDAREVISTPEFLNWLASKPTGVQALYNSDDPGDAIEMLDMFKAQVAPRRNPQAERQERLTASAAHGSSRSVADTNNGVPSDPRLAFDYYAKQFAERRGI
jgi:chromosome segregation ATPase